jgi:hypothetical protein
MPSSYTPSLRLVLPVTGELLGAWGDTVNDGLTSLAEDAIAGTANIAMTDANRTLSTNNELPDEARCMFINLTGTLTASRDVICPAVSKLYFVHNDTNQVVVFKTAAGTGVSVPVGSRMVLYCNATNVVPAVNDLPAASKVAGIEIVTISGAQTLTNKTLTSPAITTPTGLVKGDVGLGNVDNTSDATKNAATATLTNKTINGTNNTITNVSLTTGVTGTLPVANGGTGATTSTGSGAVVLQTSPSLTTPNLGTPTAGVLSSCTVDGTDAVGFRNAPVNSQSANYTLVLADSGKTIFHPASDNNARTFTIPANSSVAYPVGTVVSFINLAAADVTIAITTDTMYLGGDGATGSRTLAEFGIASALKVSSTDWVISGNGLT